MIENIGNIAQLIIAVCALILSFIAGQKQISLWRGIKNINCRLLFDKNSLFNNGKPAFMFFIQNKGLTPQNIAFIQNDKKETIRLFIDKEKRQPFILNPGQGVGIALNIDEELLRKFKNADSLLLINGLGKSKKIETKKTIQKVLKLYEQSSIKGGK